MKGRGLDGDSLLYCNSSVCLDRRTEQMLFTQKKSLEVCPEVHRGRRGLYKRRAVDNTYHPQSRPLENTQKNAPRS